MLTNRLARTLLALHVFGVLVGLERGNRNGNNSTRRMARTPRQRQRRGRNGGAMVRKKRPSKNPVDRGARKRGQGNREAAVGTGKRGCTANERALIEAAIQHWVTGQFTPLIMAVVRERDGGGGSPI